MWTIVMPGRGDVANYREPMAWFASAGLLAAGLLAAVLFLACSRSMQVTPAPRSLEEAARADSPAPSEPLVRSAPVEICVGDGHSCARTVDGRVAWWGDHVEHQAAPSDEPQLEKPRWVRQFPASASLRCGAAETCVRTAGGAVYCLGGSKDVEKLALEEPATDIALYTGGGCAALRSKQVVCWQRPVTVSGHAVDPAAAPRTRSLWTLPGLQVAHGFALAPALSNAVCTPGNEAPACASQLVQRESARVALGASSLAGADELVLANRDGSVLCAVFGDGHIRGAGDGTGGVLSKNEGLTVDRAIHPSESPGENDASPNAGPVIGTYDGGLCFRAPDGSLGCAGEPNELVSVIPPEAHAAAFGTEHACTLVEDELYCWGAASRGQLGTGPAYVRSQPVKVPGIDDAVDLDASSSQVCIVRKSGGLACWGALPIRGAPPEIDYAPRELSLPEPALEVRAARPGVAATAYEHSAGATCARTASGWWCFDGTRFRRESSAEAKAREGTPLGQWKVRSASFSPDRQCSVAPIGSLFCAAEPSFIAAHRSFKTRLLRIAPEPEPFVEVTSLFPIEGVDHTCGRTRSGKVTCFPVEPPALTPVDQPSLAALDDIVQLEAEAYAGDAIACALGRTGAVRCWGEAHWGQLPGSPARTPFEPVNITALPPIAQLAVGGPFVCARTPAGEVYCWGSNRHGTAPDGAPGASSQVARVEFPE
jgi:hypothetical protein